jgi:hypothetical protein
MGTLVDANPNSREIVTEILDRARWWDILRLIAQFFRTKGVDRVRVEFGYVLERDLAGKQQQPDDIVEFDRLTSFVEAGLEAGTIEWKKSSDFRFYPIGTDLAITLCNDADLHFVSADLLLLSELGHTISSRGVKVYDSGKLIVLEDAPS